MPRESSRRELADLVAYGGRGSGSVAGLACWSSGGETCNVRYDEAALWTLADPHTLPREERARQLWRLGQLFQAQRHGMHFRALWLDLESTQFWSADGARPALARQAWERALQGWHRIYEREPLTGDQEGAQQFPRLAELSALGCAISHYWQP